MPSAKQQKEYYPDSYYHLYNRGVGKMVIFHDEQDYAIFLYYLKVILSPLDFLKAWLDKLRRSSKNVSSIKRLQHAVFKATSTRLSQNIELLSFCLMPNHFHLIIYQKRERAIEEFMRRLGSAYSTHYRRKYHWEGSVVQGRYNASRLYYDPELQTLATMWYVERNPLPLPKNVSWYPYSSLQYYARREHQAAKTPVWLKTDHPIALFKQIKMNPQGYFEGRIACYDSLVDFILQEPDFKLEFPKNVS